MAAGVRGHFLASITPVPPAQSQADGAPHRGLDRPRLGHERSRQNPAADTPARTRRGNRRRQPERGGQNRRRQQRNIVDRDTAPECQLYWQERGFGGGGRRERPPPPA